MSNNAKKWSTTVKMVFKKMVKIWSIRSKTMKTVKNDQKWSKTVETVKTGQEQ